LLGLGRRWLERVRVLLQALPGPLHLSNLDQTLVREFRSSRVQWSGTLIQVFRHSVQTRLPAACPILWLQRLQRDMTRSWWPVVHQLCPQSADSFAARSVADVALVAGGGDGFTRALAHAAGVSCDFGCGATTVSRSFGLRYLHVRDSRFPGYEGEQIFCRRPNSRYGQRPLLLLRLGPRRASSCTSGTRPEYSCKAEEERR
jgi:hypothetical protein